MRKKVDAARRLSARCNCATPKSLLKKEQPTKLATADETATSNITESRLTPAYAYTYMYSSRGTVDSATRKP